MYRPDSLTLQKYAQVLVNFALHGGKGVKPGEVVECIFPEQAKPLAKAIHRQLLKSQAHPLMSMQADGFEEDLYRFGQDTQHRFFPEPFLRAKAQTISHTIYLSDPTQKITTEKTLGVKELRRSVLHPVEEWLDEKESQGLYSWTMAIWPTHKTAALVNMTLEQYWQELIKACQLDAKKPLVAWQKTFHTLHRLRDHLTQLSITSLHIEGADIDLKLSLPRHTRWLAGRGRNIPSYEVFTTPNFRTVDGWFRSNQTVLRSGLAITEPEFYFEAGRLTKVKASSAQTALETLLETPGMTHIGEISLTDKKLSPIRKRMGVTLLDENLGGEFGNFHLALGNSFKDCYVGSPKPTNDPDWLAMGYNISTSHIDFVSTTDREVWAIDDTDQKSCLYKAGSFLV